MVDIGQVYLGQAINILRLEKMMNTKEVAAALGITHQVYVGYEKATSYITEELVGRIAFILGVEVEEIYTLARAFQSGDDDPSKRDESFGTRMKMRRHQLGLSQRAFANLIGICQRSIAAYEIEGVFPQSTILKQIAENLDVSLDWLFNVDNDGMISIHDLLPNQRRILQSMVEEYRESNQKLLQTTSNKSKKTKKRVD